MKVIRTWGFAIAGSVLLAACGGGGGGDSTSITRGSVVVAGLVGSATTAQIDAGTSAQGIQALTGAAKCGVEVHYLNYITVDPLGAQATASEAVLVPTGTNAACSGPAPIMLYAHGTVFTKSFNMAQIATNSEAALQAAMYAAQGFIVVAPNYLGYDVSSLSYHPYLNAEAQAIDMVDGLRAAKKSLATSNPGRDSGKLFISGYSQGGHVAMATHKIIERDYSSEFTVTASVPQSGPYNLVQFSEYINSPTGVVNGGATLFTPLLLTSYQKAYGNIYTTPSDAYQSPFDKTAENLFPTDTPIATLVANGELPANDSGFTKLYGTGGLLKDSFRNDFLTNPNNGFLAALTKNTLVGANGWTPKRPIALCGGAKDPVVFFAINSPVSQADFAARGVQVPLWNLESPPATTDPTYPVYAGFAAAKAAIAQQAVAAGATDGGVAAVTAAYHETEAPFCATLARGFFQYVLATNP